MPFVKPSALFNDGRFVIRENPTVSSDLGIPVNPLAAAPIVNHESNAILPLFILLVFTLNPVIASASKSLKKKYFQKDEGCERNVQSLLNKQW